MEHTDVKEARGEMNDGENRWTPQAAQEILERGIADGGTLYFFVSVEACDCVKAARIPGETPAETAIRLGIICTDLGPLLRGAQTETSEASG